MIFLNWCVAFS